MQFWSIEPSVDGHHVGWLRFITEDLLGAGFSLTLAVDTRPAGDGTHRRTIGRPVAAREGDFSDSRRR